MSAGRVGGLLACSEATAFTPRPASGMDVAGAGCPAAVEPPLAHVERLFFRFPDGRLGERLSLLAQCLELAGSAGRLPGASR